MMGWRWRRWPAPGGGWVLRVWSVLRVLGRRGGLLATAGFGRSVGVGSGRGWDLGGWLEGVFKSSSVGRFKRLRQIASAPGVTD